MRESARTPAKTKTLFWISATYLALPSLIFLLGFVRWVPALSGVACLLVALGCFRIKRRRTPAESLLMGEPLAISPVQCLLVLAVAFLFLILSGIGGYGHQDGDWTKHNAILDVLIKQPWPVSYSFALEQTSPSSSLLNVPLVYYIAYYLPAAVVGKLFGWFWANQALFLWSYLGLCLALIWFFVLAQRATLLTLFIFVCFSGMDVAGMAIVRKLFLQEPLAFSYWEHIERWSGNWQYSANATLLFWVPNQALGGWIAGGLIFSSLLGRDRKKQLIFYLSLTPLWAPFVTLGMLPYLIADFFSGKKTFLKRVTEYFSFSNSVGVMLLLLLTLFYGAKLYPLPLPLPPVSKGFIFLHPVVPGLSLIESVSLFVLFVVLECLLYGLLVYKSGIPFSGVEKRLLKTTLIFLLILPLYRYGHWNDLVMRASIPALFFLGAFMSRALYYAAVRKRAVAVCLAVSLMIGALNSAIEFKRHIRNTYRRGTLLSVPEPVELYKVPKKNIESSFFAQYLGSAEAPFFRFVAKPLNLSKDAVPVSEINEIAPPDRVVE